MTTTPPVAPALADPELIAAYGDHVLAVEPTGAEPIPAEARHGNPLQLLWTWTSPNMEFATVFIGVLAVGVFGLGFVPRRAGADPGAPRSARSRTPSWAWPVHASACRRWSPGAAPSASSATRCPPG